MPYSKNPLKYPKEFMALLEMFMTGKVKEVRLPCGSPSEANGRRVQMQSFFAACEKYAEELTEIRARNTLKAVNLGAKAGTLAKTRVEEDFADTAALAQTWADRAYAAASLVVRMEKEPPAITIGKRQTEGMFGAALDAFLAQKVEPVIVDGQEVTDPDEMGDDDFMVWCENREDLTFEQSMRLMRLAKDRGMIKLGG